VPINRSKADGFSIGELSRRTGVHVETIRYYEKARLLPRPPRTQGGHRAYGQDGLRVLAFIKRSRELGFGLDDIRALLSLRTSDSCCSNAKAIATRHLQDVRTKMRDLAALENILAGTIAQCSDEVPGCAVIDVLDIGRTEGLSAAH
jgi:MerR family mercuric resistance operon transcriptional regulator